MDRAHRIGQSKTVNVYRLCLQNSIEERILELQERKMQTSNAIVNSENSTIFSMGTERLLDIFTLKTDNDSNRVLDMACFTDADMDAIIDSFCGDYADFDTQTFVKQLLRPI
jgi:hypothetical protein